MKSYNNKFAVKTKIIGVNTKRVVKAPPQNRLNHNNNKYNANTSNRHQLLS